MSQLFGVVSLVAYTPWNAPSENSGEDDTFTFNIQNKNCVFSTSDKPVISVSIAGVSRDVLINSGSFNNLIRQDTVQELKDQGLKIGLQPCTKKRQRA